MLIKTKSSEDCLRRLKCCLSVNSHSSDRKGTRGTGEQGDLPEVAVAEPREGVGGLPQEAVSQPQGNA